MNKVRTSVLKATAIAPSNIAFSKYWGRKDNILRLPANGSISMTLSDLLTTTTVEFSPAYERSSPSDKKDQVTINGGGIEEGEEMRVIKHLDRVRKLSGINFKAKVASKNNFPAGTGLASSASGFAALTLAAISAAGLRLSDKELSILARQGSGSACRSIPGGFVEWLNGDTSETSYATQIFPSDYWDIADVVAIFTEEKKEVSSSTGHEAAQSSPFFKTRIAGMKQKNEEFKRFIKQRNFEKFGQLLEREALEFHAITLTQNPYLIYWTAGTLATMKKTAVLRNKGLPVYFTVDTGQNIHLFVEGKNIKRLVSELKKLEGIKNIIINKPGEGTRLSENHLF